MTQLNVNMFRDCGVEGFHANSYGVRTDIILVIEGNNTIYVKDSIELGNKVYLKSGIELGTVESCSVFEAPVGLIHIIETSTGDMPKEMVDEILLDREMKTELDNISEQI